MNEVKLLPCPFCGSDRVEVWVYNDADPEPPTYTPDFEIREGDMFEIGCFGCDFCTGHFMRPEHVIDKWNRRPDSAALEVTNDHTTHFDDCGCKSAKYEAKLAHLQERLDEAEKALRDAQREIAGAMILSVHAQQWRRISKAHSILIMAVDGITTTVSQRRETQET